MKFQSEDILNLLAGWKEALGNKARVTFVATPEVAYFYRGDTGITLGVVTETSIKGS